MLKKIIIWVCIGGVVISILTGCKKNRNEGAKKEEIAEVKNTVDAYGVVAAGYSENISIDFPAQTTYVFCDEGERIGWQQKLIKLDISDFRVEILTKENELQQAKSDLASIMIDQQKLQNELNKAVVDYNDAMTNYENIDGSFKTGAVAKSDLDTAQNNLAEKKKNLDNIKISMAKYRTGDDTSLIETQKSRIKLLENDLARLKSKINQPTVAGDTIISNIKNGVIYDISVKPGDTITMPTQLCTIIDMDTLFISADIPEESIREVAIGAAVDIRPDADRSKLFKGRVTRISAKAAVKNGETVIPVEITFEDNEHFFLPDFNVDVTIYNKE